MPRAFGLVVLDELTTEDVALAKLAGMELLVRVAGAVVCV
jgi:hypothetical protein